MPKVLTPFPTLKPGQVVDILSVNHEARERQDRDGYEIAQKDARADEAGAIH
jgi:hypothetical protein